MLRNYGNGTCRTRRTGPLYSNLDRFHILWRRRTSAMILFRSYGDRTCGTILSHSQSSIITQFFKILRRRNLRNHHIPLPFIITLILLRSYGGGTCGTSRIGPLLRCLASMASRPHSSLWNTTRYRNALSATVKIIYRKGRPTMSYIYRVPQCTYVPCRNWDCLTPLSPASVPLTPEPMGEGGGHTRLRVRG
jgi:hypothetical protein